MYECKYVFMYVFMSGCLDLCMSVFMNVCMQACMRTWICYREFEHVYACMIERGKETRPQKGSLEV